MAIDQRRSVSIHRHLAGVGAFITGAVGGLFLLILLWVSFQSSRDQVLDRSAALARVLLDLSPLEGCEHKASPSAFNGVDLDIFLFGLSLA